MLPCSNFEWAIHLWLNTSRLKNVWHVSRHDGDAFLGINLHERFMRNGWLVHNSSGTFLGGVCGTIFHVWTSNQISNWFQPRNRLWQLWKWQNRTSKADMTCWGYAPSATHIHIVRMINAAIVLMFIFRRMRAPRSLYVINLRAAQWKMQGTTKWPTGGNIFRKSACFMMIYVISLGALITEFA